MKELSLKELQVFCLEILQDVHDFCEENEITYSLYAGSMLGAIRHQGYIPWDDDVDIIMPRPDYNRFCSTYHSPRYKIVNHDIDPNCYIAFTRVCDMDKTTTVSHSPWCSVNTGCWIDIFPADGFPGDEEEQKNLYAQCISLRTSLIRQRQIKSMFYGGIRHRTKMLIEKIVSLNGIRAKSLVDELLLTIQQYPLTESPYWASLTNVRNTKEWKHHPINTFQHCSLMNFWDRKFYVLDGYDMVLSQRFGDYMKLPPVEEQKPKQSYIRFYWK